MGQRIHLDSSPTGVQHSVEIDHDGNGFYAVEHTPTHIESEILDNCARMRSMHQISGSAFKHAAHIPINTYMAWKKEWRENHSDTWSWATFEAMKLNNRDFEKLRTGYKRGGSMKL